MIEDQFSNIFMTRLILGLLRGSGTNSSLAKSLSFSEILGSSGIK